MKATDIAAALDRSPLVHEYALQQRRFEHLELSVGEQPQERRAQGRRQVVTIYVDQRQGRGRAQFSVVADTELDEQIVLASARARNALGPSWQLPPPSAPARVLLNDADFVRPLQPLSEGVVAAMHAQRPQKLKLLQAELKIHRNTDKSVVSNGFANSFVSTDVRVQMRLQGRGGAPVEVQMQARSALDLNWKQVYENALIRSLEQPSATPPPPGACDVVFLSEGYAPAEAEDWGMWTPLVLQCSAERARNGMAKYLRGQSILDSPAKGDLLTMRSDGTLAYALRTAPFGAMGQAVRRFPIVESSVAAGYALEYRDAALVGEPGGSSVANLVIETGGHAEEELLRPGSVPLLVVQSVAQVDTTDRGGLCIRLGHGRWLTQGEEARPVVGGALTGNLYHWLQEVFFSRQQTRRGWCLGPKAIRFNGLSVC